ncbi:MAG: hypothetical protein A2270_06195 [Elusimicrobia bacterium RIFOXYA12_FULL_51_18]|nr:MAG: hypothetical protein A2270_06195 [Elusimicrobia bacterium RIFOXYA12_FULL_51_18]OGS32683.1 MAG: hypothetical protein A2218_11530 [Elusimicrobia bacterium RIFOXYA2_FULL_53_38]
MKFIKESKQSIYSALIVTGGILLASEGLFGEGLKGAVATAGLSGLFFAAAAITYIAGKKELCRGFFSSAAVFLLGVGVHVAAVKVNTVMAQHRLGVIASAAESYKSKYGKRPDSLNVLAPEFISSIPRAKYTLMSGQFYLADSKIMFVGPMPFMTYGYDLTTGKMGYTGSKGVFRALARPL